MQVFVKRITGKTYTLDFDENTTVEDLKIQCQKSTGIPINEQNLVYYGRNLFDDDAKLVDCGVSDKTTIDLVLKLHGG